MNAKRFRFATDIHVQQDSNVVLVSIPESVIGKKVTAETTSHRKLTFLKKQFAKDLGLTVEFIIVRGTVHAQIEAGLNAYLTSQFTNAIKEAFLSFREDGIHDVWLDPVDVNVDIRLMMPQIQQALRQYLQLFNARLGSVEVISTGTPLPSLSNILRQVKKLSPASAKDLFGSFQSSGINMPSHSWLDRKLDALRKRGLLIRREDGNYALTELGLSTVPHGKNRASSDIERALALAKRKW